MMVFPGGAGSKEPACQLRDAGDEGLIPGSGRSLEGGNGSPLQYSFLKNPMDRGAWLGYSPQAHKELDMTEATWYGMVCLHKKF